MEDLVTTMSLVRPRPPLTVAAYAAMPEDIDQHWELVEGNLVMSPSATPSHNYAGRELLAVLGTGAPAENVVIYDVDVDLQLAPDSEPGTVRAPDVVVLTRSGFDRVKREGGLLRASEVVLVVEVVSPGSRRTDRLVKLAEYADAGIQHYWIVDLDAGPSLLANRLVDGRYEQSEPITGTFTAEAPFPVTVDLTALV